ncbi:MAG: TAT-variant-translocated molybdopterin oxidoreductase [Terrimicrobiaceae bacterium]|nr:TAT-variant-translocated molybdopterin oxidoreductase [Terrimicrobiaceae bacterium]
MKRIVNHPPREAKPRIWRSLREFENDPEFDKHLQTEFPRGAEVYQDSGLSKRDFMKLMGASIALAGVGLGGCRRPEAYLVPFTKGVEWTIPGKFLFYATAMPARYGAVPLIATTSDGRPTKLEGNPLHPFSNGGTDAFAQASVLDLYDPHRSKAVLENGKPAADGAFDAFLQEVSQSGGRGVAFLVEKKNSPTRDRLRAELERNFPGLLWAEYEPLGDAPAAAATAAVFGEGVSLLPRLDRSDVILALDSDFLNPSEVGIGYAAGFSARRNPDQKGAPMNRLYVVENHYTPTGGMADHRLRLRASDIGEFARRLGEVIAARTGDGDLAAVVGATPKSAATIDEKWVTECANDLAANVGRSLVLTGPQSPVALQVLVLAINKALGAVGTTLAALRSEAPPVASISDLASAMAAGSVQTLFILGGNPAYNAPADLGFADLLGKVPNVVRHGLFEDETSKVARWHVPAAHYLESWGDVRTADGTYTSIQPMILPLWGGIPELDLLTRLLGGTPSEGPDAVRATFEQIADGGAVSEAGGIDLLWNSFLRIGFLPGTQAPEVSPTFSTSGASRLIAENRAQAAEGLELVFLQSTQTDDGRYANNSWMLETPDFVTKLTWDNAVLLSPATAKELGVKANNFGAFKKIAEAMGNEINYDLVGDIVELSDGKTTIEAAAIVAPGHADNSLSIALGFGRNDVSALMQNVGFNAYPLRSSANPRFTTGVTLKRTGKTYPLAQTQEHRSMEGRDLVREGTLERYQKDPKFAQTMGMDGHIPPNISLYSHPLLTSKEQWGMTVDLNTCTGCNACVVACQAENNVPVVGKDQVRKNRDMAWIRIDRYFAGENPDDPEMLSQAMLCQHCENAPCETVCPVNATVHSEDGLNLMAYNRCIGTRYCANNCPWKVRRFNYFDYNQRPLDKLYWGPLAPKGMADSVKMVKNPNVTVRMRGVMEKCTFCIQRIEEAKIARLVEAGPTPASETPISPFKVACQQACPNDSIVFGDINNPNTRVHQLRQADRGYVMFKYLNANPRITYLTRIKNPNPRMPGAELVGMANGVPHGAHGDDASHGHGSAESHGKPATDAHHPAENHGEAAHH